MVIYCEGKEMAQIIDDCYRISSENACENCVLHNALCGNSGCEITFRLRSKENVQSREQI